jgi:nucleotide-binding universal stress UspA family protein
MYSTILIALENTETDRTILTHVRPLAKLCGSSLVLMHVADGFAARTQQALNLQDSEEIIADRAYLERCCSELKAEGFNAAWELGKGDPATSLVQHAEAIKADLIAMATHGHGLINDVLRGSVASEVRHKTTIPVLMVRAGR